MSCSLLALILAILLGTTSFRRLGSGTDFLFGPRDQAEPALRPGAPAGE